MLHYETYECYSTAPWIVFLHGAGGNSRTWKYQVEHFRENFNLLIPDLRDHGQSQLVPPGDSYSFSLISKDILEVIDEAGIKQAVFISLSFGSVLLQDLSMRRPGLVQAAVFAGGIFRANRLIRSYVHVARIMNVILPYPTMYRLFSWLLMPGKKHQFSRRLYQRQAAKLTPEAYLRWVTLYSEFFSLLDTFDQQDIQFPALVIMGKEDRIFLSAARRFVSRQGPHVGLLLIEGAGHICNIDEAEKFNRQAFAFVSEHLLTSSQAGE